jgi:amidase
MTRPPDSHSPAQPTARSLASRLQARELTAVAALQDHLERIARHNPQLNAVVSVDVDRALARAEAADAALRQGDVWGPLHGVPITLKDGHDVAGLRTTLGTEQLDRIADEDGTVARRLREAGAIITGHTNVAAWLADDQQSANSVFGRTSNPWDVERVPGGSSGGAASAVAAGLTPFDIGSDFAGSIRLPAHFCGVYGLKSTEHRVPLTGFFRPPPDMPRPVRIISCLGPIARDLGDIELALRLIAGPDGLDGDVPPVPLKPRRRRDLPDLRLAVATTVPDTTVAAAIQERVRDVAAGALAAGARVEQRLPDVDWAASSRVYGDLAWTIASVLDPQADLPDEQRTLAWYLDALDRRDRFIAVWQAFFAEFDALVLPQAMTVAFTHRETGAPLDVDGQTVDYGGNGRLYGFANLTGLPSLCVPAGQVDGLPVGLQIVGPLWSEIRLIDIAESLEQAGILPGFRSPPGY